MQMLSGQIAGCAANGSSTRMHQRIDALREKQRGAAAMAGMRSLDSQLYAWLSEPDDARFESAFADYFKVAFPAVVRYLARVSRWDSLRLEDLAQEALLR